MKSSSDDDLSGQYRQFMAAYPLQTASFGTQSWDWLDSRQGQTILILLPGFMGEAETSFLFMQALARHLRVISISYPPSIGRVDDLCDGLCALMDHLGLENAIFLGGSSSGFVAQAFVRRHASRTSGLILTHTGLPSPARARTARIYLGLLRSLPFNLLHWLMQFFIYSYFPRSTPTHTFWRAHFREIIRRQTLLALRNRFALMNDFHSAYRFQPGDLAGWPGKILIMEMRHDHLTTPFEQQTMRELYPGARVHVFSETAHYDSVEQPEQQIRVIMDFLIAEFIPFSSTRHP